MFEFLTPAWMTAGLAVAAVLAWLFLRNAKAQQATQAERARMDRLDTVTDWPAEGTRLLNATSRQAHAALVSALPECTVFAKVPVARFVRVPRRQSYAEWIKRVGQLAVDFLVCDQSTKALAVVMLQSDHDSPKAQKRRDRIYRVLKGAQIKVFVWREEALPSAAAARAMMFEVTDTSPPIQTAPPKTAQDPSSDPVLDDEAAIDPWGGHEPRLDPPPSTWFDDLDTAPAPLSPPAQRKAAA
jgi:Protein of unknown function (DUF2726)